MSKTPEEMAEEYVEAEFKGRGGNVSRAVCKYDFMSGYRAAIDLIHSKTTKEMSDLANAFAANYLGKEYAVSFDSYLAGYQAAKQETNLPTSGKWISVKERLPEEDVGWIMVYGCILSRWSVQPAFYDRQREEWIRWFIGGDCDEGGYAPLESVTYWHLPPEPPKEEK